LSNRDYCRKGENNFNGEAALLFRACFHIEGDWRPFEDGILWENEGPPHPLKLIYIIILFFSLCNITYKKTDFLTFLIISATHIYIFGKKPHNDNINCTSESKKIKRKTTS